VSLSKKSESPLKGREANHARPYLYVLLMRQDDPRKCTSAKLVRFRLAGPLYRLRQIPRSALVLDPMAESVLLPSDRTLAQRSGVVAVDCSWERVQEVFSVKLPGRGRRLPKLLAGNPVNYGAAHKLSSIEALAAALFIMGFRERAKQLLSLFKWGEGFLALNSEPLEAYSKVSGPEDLFRAEADFF